MRMHAKYTGAAYTLKSTTDFSVELINPCDDPVSLTPAAQTNPADYLYTGTDVTFTLTPFTVDPSICDVVYTCISIPMDLCSIGNTHATFDSVTGGWVFNTVDLPAYPAGTYSFTITGTVGLKSTTSTFQLSLVDPCPSALLTYQSPHPITDSTYTLRDVE